jgi:hypothetical protein
MERNTFASFVLFRTHCIAYSTACSRFDLLNREPLFHTSNFTLRIEDFNRNADSDCQGQILFREKRNGGKTHEGLHIN